VGDWETKWQANHILGGGAVLIEVVNPQDLQVLHRSGPAAAETTHNEV
jgi:hypothetical protein